jgi:Short-chain dehydrogenases of various substrate specificities
MGKLDGKTVLVTGASRGIGAEIARLFAGEGGRVICAARTLREGEHPLAGSLETTVAGIRAEGGTAEAVTANIADPAECERLVATTREITARWMSS